MKKKLLFLINTMGRAGAETALLGLLNRLDALGRYQISLYVILPRGELFDRIPSGVRLLNRRISRGSVLSPAGRLFIAGRILHSFFYRLTGFRMLPALWRNFMRQRAAGRVQYDKLFWRLLADGLPAQRETYDLAVAYIEGAAAYYLADRVRAAHKAAFIHIDYQAAGYQPEDDQGCYDGMERIFVVSREVGRKFAAVYPQYQNKIRLFRNILDGAEILRKAESGTGFTDGYDGFRLVTVGRLTYQKGYDIAVEALARLRAAGYDVRWYVLGEGPERAKLEAQIGRLGVRDNFVLMGAKDNPYPYIRQADLYVHATRYEGKSIAVEEAQILRRPIAASNCTGNTEQIRSGYDGVLFPLGVERLVRAVAWLIDHPAERAEMAARTAERQQVHPEDLEQLLALLHPGKEENHESSASDYSGL